ncbi:MAG: glycosyltransferase [Solobacterium sp.]|nr:glycosyltransferase [Solobacterium sp.]
MKPDISVIIPLYNCADTVRFMLDAILAQTKKNVEYLCVDDGSTDATPEILREYAEKCADIKIIRNERNSGVMMSRKNAVSVSEGKYLMFADGDDTMSPEFCAKAFEAIEREQTDVVQFSATINYVSGLTEDGIATGSKTMHSNPKSGIHTDTNLLSSDCWKSKTYIYYMWNKIYNGDLVRKVYKEMIDGRTVGDDYYFNMLFSLYASSYASIDDVLYEYNFGEGVSSLQRVNTQQLEIFLAPREFCRHMEERLAEEPEDYSAYILAANRHFISDALVRLKLMDERNLSEAFSRIVEVWGLGKVTDTVYSTSVQGRNELIEVLSHIDYFKRPVLQNEKPMTVASYYPKLSNGGVERVMCNICSMLAEMKDDSGDAEYNVIIITDEKNEDYNSISEYAYSDKIRRMYLPAVKPGESFEPRFEAWNRIIDECGIDAVIENIWADTSFIADAVCIKGNKRHPMLINHFHNFVGEMFRFRNALAEYSTKFWQFIDGVVVLSETDKRFVEAFTRNVAYIPNPMTFASGSAESKYEDNYILWAGRFAEEKHPEEAVIMMSSLVKKNPQAMLHMVGTGKEEIVERVKNAVVSLGLENNVVFEGFSESMDEYYSKAAVFVSTSSTEGYPLTFYEAISFGVPVVMYDLPWLTFAEDGRGAVTVPQKRTIQLADELSRILSDGKYRKELSDKALAHANDVRATDIPLKWKEYLDAVNVNPEHGSENNAENILFRMITKKQNESKIYWNDEYESVLSQTKTYRSKLDESRSRIDNLRQEASANWQARNKAVEEAAANWQARNKAVEEASANWQARNKAIEEKNAALRDKRAAEQELALLQTENRKLQDTYENLLDRNTSLEQNYNALEGQFTEMAKDYKEITEHWSYKLFGKKKAGNQSNK